MFEQTFVDTGKTNKTWTVIRFVRRPDRRDQQWW